MLKRLTFTVVFGLGIAGAQLALAQTGATSPDLSGRDTAARTTHPRQARHGKPASADMNVGGAAASPTEPYTNTSDAPQTSDLSGSTGPGVQTPAAPPPPGVAPPGGAPDTGGAETPNTAGGPHA